MGYTSNRGYTLTKLERYEEALAAQNEALRLNSNLSDAYYNRAVIHAFQGEVDLAVADLQQAIQLNPSHRQEATTEVCPIV